MSTLGTNEVPFFNAWSTFTSKSPHIKLRSQKASHILRRTTHWWWRDVMWCTTSIAAFQIFILIWFSLDLFKLAVQSKGRVSLHRPWSRADSELWFRQDHHSFPTSILLSKKKSYRTIPYIYIRLWSHIAFLLPAHMGSSSYKITVTNPIPNPFLTLLILQEQQNHFTVTTDPSRQPSKPVV